jgi:GntR family transcriptional repressor for pyruvate dehydrogenase complex
MSFEPVNRTRVADQVSSAIRTAIITNQYQAGDKLPSERELAEQFGVNRSSIREALHRLEAWKLVEIRHGGGVTVQDLLGGAGLYALPWLLVPNGEIDPEMLWDVLRLRVGLLSFAAEEAAQHSDSQDVAVLSDILTRIESAETREEIQRADYAFFEALIAATRNRALMLVVNAITPVYEYNRATFVALYPAEMDTIAHRACVAAIAEHDEEAASQAMRAYALGGLLAMADLITPDTSTKQSETL